MYYHNVVLRTHSDTGFVHDSLREHAKRSREEPGCVRFDVHLGPNLPSTFILTEQWINKHAVDAHRLGGSYQEVYKQRVLPLVMREPNPEGVAFDFDRTLTAHARPLERTLELLRHLAETKPVYIVTARNPRFDTELVRNYDEPQRLLVDEAVREWNLPVAGVRFTNNEPKILHLIELGCCCVVDDCERTRRDAANHGLATIDPLDL